MTKVNESATDRLSRLLAMVPWLLAHQGVPLAAAAAEFGIDEPQLVKDLELLFVCGLPGHMPDDLIEADWEDGVVYIANADAISRPLRLGVDEALALIVGLRALADVPGLGDRDAVSRALAKLETAAGAAAAGADSVRVDLPQDGDPAVVSACEDALRRGRRLHLGYLVPHRDETTERDVDPMRLLHLDSHWYLEGWCHRAEAVRMFRLDRVVGVQVLDIDGSPPATARSRDLDAGLFAPWPRRHARHAGRRGARPVGRRLLPGRVGRRPRGRLPAAAAAYGGHGVAASAGAAARGRGACPGPAVAGAGRDHRRSFGAGRLQPR